LSIQLLRVECEYYRPGDEIHGAGNVTLYTKPIAVGAGIGIWVARTDPQVTSVIVGRDKIAFTHVCAFLRIKALGLETDGINSGDLDFQFTVEPAQKVLGQALYEIVAVGEQVTEMNAKDRKISFIAVVEHTSEGCKFLGVLDMDINSLKAVMTPFKIDNEMPIVKSPSF
jgi:hypothetical protein